jgi:tRNA (guanine10-N2)-dimethyltransferase
LVNLAGLDDHQVLLDPFCGTGGLLLEAGLMGMTVIGSDIDPQMVAGTKANLEHWGINNYSLINSDIENLPVNLRKQGSAGQPQAIVTEPPYGRASTTQGQALDELLRKSFKIFSEILKPNGSLVISLPDPELAHSIHRDFKLMNKFTFRVHKSLTKTIFVFELQK